MFAFQIESLKNVTFNVSVLVVDRSVGEAGETPWYVHTHYESNVTVVWQHVLSQVWAGLRGFFQSGGSVFYKAASTKKLLCKSHSSLNSVWRAVVTLKLGASKASPTFSKKSVIHAVVNVFCFFFLSCFCLICNPWLLCLNFLVLPLTRDCFSLHTTQFFKCYCRPGEAPF